MKRISKEEIASACRRVKIDSDLARIAQAQLESCEKELEVAINGAYKAGVEKGRQMERERIIKWGNEPCEEHMQRIYRRQCPQCWQELQELAK